jgi:demethylmenaquinone methyltransferase/2-methoxy-6-polyprenyl-1,4-benzoquinol methylase
MSVKPTNIGVDPDGSGAMFDSIAGRYDLLNRMMSLGWDRRWRRKTAEQLLSPGRVLDLATGTCDLAIDVAGLYPHCRVTGLDPSARMLEIGQRKVSQLGLCERVDLVLGDAQALPFTDGSFDAITMAFGIRNVPDRAAALAEMVRVATDGARIAILELTDPRGAGLAALARLHTRFVVPALGAILSGRAQYAYLTRSIAHFPQPRDFVALAEKCGLRMLRLVPFSFGACHLFVFTPTIRCSA